MSYGSRFFDTNRQLKPLSDFIIEVWGKGGKRKGFSRKRAPSGNLYPYGFTPPEEFWVDAEKLDPRAAELGISQSGGYFGGSVEYGTRIFTHPSKFYTVNSADRLQNRYATYDFQEEFARKKFIHLLDSFQEKTDDVKGNLKKEAAPGEWKYNSLYTTNLSRSNNVEQFFFYQTPFDNEDPTYYGFDIEIDGENSPLFNGDVVKFIRTFGQYDAEISSRENIYKIFKTQIFKFIKSNRANTDNPLSEIGNGKFQERAYYIQSIAGLDKVVENFGEGSDVKQFVDYKKDMIKLSFKEDVSQNIGYLTTLYKLLSYSRTKGKYVIPENLLRFDIKIIVTDIRKFNRFVRNTDANGNLDRIYAFSDNISRYEYKLYECQFKFDKMPHGDQIKNNDTPGTEPEDYVINFDFKFSTLNFRKFSGHILGSGNPEAGKPYNGVIYYYDVDNSKRLGTYSQSEIEQKKDLGFEYVNSYAITNYSTTQEDGKAHYQMNTQVGIEADTEIFLKDVPTSITSGIFKAPNYGLEINDEDRIKTLSRREKLKQAVKSRLKNQWENLKEAGGDVARALANAGINEVNRQIQSKAALLNKSIEKIRNGIPGLERMSAPRNVYAKYDPLEASILNAFRAGGPLVSALLSNGYLEGKDRLKAALDKTKSFAPKSPTNVTGYTNVYGGGVGGNAGGPRGPL